MPTPWDSSTVYRRLRVPDSPVRILLQLTKDPKEHKEHMHIDLETDDIEVEVRRLEALAAPDELATWPSMA
ncbi:VOC family protein [Pseudonocardia lacus]|uniref:VOC family protein n=1 Tax=Pseudonocardia lacus TaxID=2835865 RepID=UPI001BDBBF2F|nr:VOC family protein [Pseudonocardia lacus]